jgi:hypothetical protein
VIIAGVVIAAGACALLAAWQITQPAGLPRASCGQAVTHDLGASTQILSADPGALRCFGSAAGGCRPASIEITQMGVDSGTRYVLTIGPGGAACQVSGLSQDYGGPGWKGPVRAVPFRLAAVTGQGVMLRCGGQAVLIPAAMNVR